MVSGRDVVVSVGLDTFDRIVWIEAKFIQNLLVDGVFDWHELFAWEKAWGLFIVGLAEPGMVSDLLDSIALLRLSLEDF